MYWILSQSFSSLNASYWFYHKNYPVLNKPFHKCKYSSIKFSPRNVCSYDIFDISFNLLFIKFKFPYAKHMQDYNADYIILNWILKVHYWFQIFVVLDKSLQGIARKWTAPSTYIIKFFKLQNWTLFIYVHNHCSVIDLRYKERGFFCWDFKTKVKWD